jgi:probable F420-dependent oxidoreductase
MRFGINILARRESSDLRQIGQRIEASGFDSLFLPEHTHIPVKGDVHTAGDETHERMKELPDPYVVLTAVVAVTSTIRVGTGVSLIAQHDPIALAKRIATIDQLSEGRFILGIGSGWNRSEAANHGVQPKKRWAIMREHVLAMKQIWTSKEASFHGGHIHFDDIWSWPKPVQQPHPPVVVGGEGPMVLERVLEYGDAWGPHPVPGVVERIVELQKLAEQRNRPRIPVTLFNVRPDEAMIDVYAGAGVDRCVLYI